MKPIAILTCGAILLAGCNSDTITGSPAENELNGLSYDFRNQGGFIGVPETLQTDMPMQGTAAYAGVLRGNVNAGYQSGTAAMDVNFLRSTLNVRGIVDFQGEGGIGVVTFNEDAVITGNRFENPIDPQTEEVGTMISGKFYGADAAMAAGSVGVPLTGGEYFSGTFITQKR